VAADQPTAAVFLQETQSDRDKEAVADVRKQAKSAKPGSRSLYSRTAQSLEIERQAARAFERDVAGLYGRVTKTLRALISDGAGNEAALVNISRLSIDDLLRELGLNDVIESFTTAQLKLLDAATKQAKAAGFDDVGALSPSEPALKAAFTRTLEAFWEEQVILPTRRAILDAATDALTVTPMPVVAARLERNLATTKAQATTQARTEVARWSRTVSATTAAQVDAELFVYLGPVDGITRPFCRALANTIVTRDQLADLDNGQTPDSPLTAGGGYNCRHAFQPVSDRWAKRSGLPFATDGDITMANLAARRAA
jgi:hypothetical protein